MQMQRTILWIVFSLSLVMLWDAWQQYVGNPSLFGPRVATTADAGATGGGVQSQSGAGTPGVPAVPGEGVTGQPPATGAPAAAGDTPTAGAAPGAAGLPADVSSPRTGVAPADPGQVFELGNDLIRLQVQAKGAVLSHAELLRYRESGGDGRVVILTSRADKFYVAQAGLIGAPSGQSFPTHHTVFEARPGASDGRLILAAESGGLRLEREYSLTPGSYVIGVSDRITNLTGDSLAPIAYRQLTRDNHQPPGDTMFYSTFAGPVIYTQAAKFKKIPFDDIMSGKAEHATVAADGWLGIIQHYFLSAWLPPENTPREFYTQKSGPTLVSVGYKQALPALGGGQSSESTARLYVGPQDQNTLASLTEGLELTVDYGFLTIIAKPLHGLLDFLHGIVGNWGWAIVLLTLIIKTLFFPLQAASYKSMARMKAVTPRLTALRERYADDKAKLNQAMMELYKNEKINPLGGCLPILVQIPVFIALYWVLQASVEIRDAPWIGWIRDLASPDPFFILPALMAISMFVQVKLNPKPPDPMQAKVMMAMPVVFSVMFFFFPAGLVLYWLVNNIYSIVQQWVITRKIVADPLA